MKEWSDEELDKLFRKSAGEFEPPFEPDDWQELRHRLDTADHAPGAGWLEQARPWTIALLMLMTVGGISVYYTGTQHSEKRDTILTAPDRRSPRSSAGQELLHERKNTSDASNSTRHTETVVSENRATGKKLSGEPSGKEIPRNRKFPLNRKKTGLDEDIKELPRNLANVSGVRDQTILRNQERGEGAILLPKGIRGKGTRQENSPPGLGPAAVPPSSDLKPGAMDGLRTKEMMVDAEEPSFPLANEEEPGQSLILARLPNRPVMPSGSNLSLPAVMCRSLADSASVAKHTAAKVPKWAIRIGASPDLSFVDMSIKNMARPGPAASLLAEYSVTQRWTVQTGAIRSLKTYSAQAGAYEWPSGWYQKQRPVSVDGSCEVFELPLNLRYDFSQGKKERWFTGVGVSSYKMQKEKYVYNYTAYDPNIRWWKWEGQTGWYLFSHANASVGYERILTKKLSIMAEPYIRIPLRGVGFGKVNLFSTGVWFSIRYAPVLNK